MGRNEEGEKEDRQIGRRKVGKERFDINDKLESSSDSVL